MNIYSDGSEIFSADTFPRTRWRSAICTVRVLIQIRCQLLQFELFTLSEHALKFLFWIFYSTKVGVKFITFPLVSFEM